MTRYVKPPELYDGLRLHQNENTGGCSPRVLDALRTLRADQIGFYPPYATTVEACATHFGVSPDLVALTNGLDEGIMGLAVAYLRSAGNGTLPEAVIPEPAFEIFEFDTEVVGGRAVTVAPRPDFEFALDSVLSAITPRTRVVFLTNPNNPTGVPMPLDAIRTIAAAVPQEAVGLRRRGVRGLHGDDVYSAPVLAPQRDRRADVLQSVRTRRPANRLHDRRSGAARPDSPDHSGLQREHRRRCRPAVPHWKIERSSRTTSVRSLSRRLCCMPLATASGSGTGRAARTLSWSRQATAPRSSSRARRPVASIFAIAPPNQAARAASASARVSWSTRVGASMSWKRCYAPRGDRPTHDGNPDQAVADAGGEGPLRVRTGIRFLDHMLELVARHGAFDVRIEATGDLDVDQHHTVEDLGHRTR